jgi:Flp pilus assembly protein TadG
MHLSAEVERKAMLKNPDTLCPTAPEIPQKPGRLPRVVCADEGSTVAEMALVLPVLLVVLTGIFSFGIALNQYLVLTNAVNSGARAFALSAGGPSNSTSTATNSDPCVFAATTIAGATPNLTSSNLTFTITYTVTSTGTATVYTANAGASPSCSGLVMNEDDVVSVKAVYPISPVIFGWATKSLSLTAQSTELVQ